MHFSLTIPFLTSNITSNIVVYGFVRKVYIQLTICNISSIRNIYTEYRDICYRECCITISILSQLLLNAGNTSIISIDISQQLHCLGNNGITIVIDIWEILLICITIQATSIINLNAILILIELYRRIRLIISVHYSIHQQLSNSPSRIVINHLLTQWTYWLGTLLYNCSFNESIEFRQNIE